MNDEIFLKRILIVDDDPDIRLSLLTFLEAQGYMCHEAENGHTALERLDSQDFDLIITDYQMPKMDGLELIKKLSEYPDYKGIPIIMISGSLDRYLHDQAFQAGVNAVLQKPYAGAELLSLVQRALKSCPCPCS